MKKQISINYNGRRTLVTCMAGNKFYVQITSSPYIIENHKTGEGSFRWLEAEGQRETELSQMIGKLIEEEHFCAG